MLLKGIWDGVYQVALHPEGVDRNSAALRLFRGFFPSPSTRRAWIEIIGVALKWLSARVALHPAGVDRNRHIEQSAKNGAVALHPEGVDRNRNTRILRCSKSGRPPPGGRG